MPTFISPSLQRINNRVEKDKPKISHSKYLSRLAMSRPSSIDSVLVNSSCQKAVSSAVPQDNKQAATCSGSYAPYREQVKIYEILHMTVDEAFDKAAKGQPAPESGSHVLMISSRCL